MKNVPRKCPMCRLPFPIPRCEEVIECSACDFYAWVSPTGIDFWKTEIRLDGKYWEINSRKHGDGDYACTELWGVNDELFISLREWYPYITGRFVKDTTALVKRLLKLKAFY